MGICLSKDERKAAREAKAARKKAAEDKAGTTANTDTDGEVKDAPKDAGSADNMICKFYSRDVLFWPCMRMRGYLSMMLEVFVTLYECHWYKI